MPLRFYAMATWHPARILRGGSALDLPARQHLAHFRDTLASLSLQRHPTSYVEAGSAPDSSILAPTLPDLYQYGPLAGGVAVDIECAGEFLRGIGFCTLDGYRPLWVPFRRQGGIPYWSEADLPKAVAWVSQVLAAPWVPKVFHNGGSFDIPYLEGLGFEVNNYLADTMLMQHLAYPEQPAGLQFIATLYNRRPHWKRLSDLEEEGEDK